MNRDIIRYYAYIRFSFGLVGIVGSVLMLVVYSTKNLRRLTVSVYFRAMSITNLWVNFDSVLQLTEFLLDINTITMSNFSCKTLKFLSYISDALSAWFLVAISIDRFFNIFNTIRLQIIKKTQFAIGVVIGICVFNLLIYVQLFFTINIDIMPISRNKSLIVCHEKVGLSFRILDMMISAALPFLFMLFTSISIMVGIHRTRRRINITRRGNAQQRLTQLRDIKFGITIVALNVTFLLWNAPRPVFLFVQYIKLLGSVSVSNLIIMSVIFLFFQNLFYAITFYEQVLTNKIVRKTLINLLTNK